VSAAPKGFGSVIAQMPFLRTDDQDTNLSRAVQLIGYIGVAREAARRYRFAVLTYDDLSEQLKTLFGYSRAATWNGYVPPRLDDQSTYNSSPYRAALIEIVTEALKRSDSHEPYDDDWLAPVPESRIRAPWKDNRPAFVVDADRSAAILGEGARGSD